MTIRLRRKKGSLKERILLPTLKGLWAIGRGRAATEEGNPRIEESMGLGCGVRGQFEGMSPAKSGLFQERGPLLQASPE